MQARTPLSRLASQGLFALVLLPLETEAEPELAQHQTGSQLSFQNGGTPNSQEVVSLQSFFGLGHLVSLG